jgi:hypothetical protein
MPAISELRPMTLREADEYIGPADRRRICIDTDLIRNGDNSIAVRFQGIDIVTINHNGTFTLTMGGLPDVRKMRRINALTPARLRQPYGAGWFLSPGTVPDMRFVDRMVVDKFGREVCKVRNPLTAQNAAL